MSGTTYSFKEFHIAVLCALFGGILLGFLLGFVVGGLLP